MGCTSLKLKVAEMRHEIKDCADPRSLYCNVCKPQISKHGWSLQMTVDFFANEPVCHSQGRQSW